MDIPKKLKEITIHTFGNDTAMLVSDTADDNKATRALNEFEAYGTMHLVDDASARQILEIPFHAVQYIEVFETDGTQERPDPYGCTEETNGVEEPIEGGE